jgi:hypothetical protein
MWDSFACPTAKNVICFIISIAVLENVPPDAGLQKRATFSTLNVGLDGTGNQSQDTSVASSGTNRSAIHYAFKALAASCLPTPRTSEYPDCRLLRFFDKTTLHSKLGISELHITQAESCATNQEPLNLRTNHGKIRISIDGRFWPLFLQ